MDVAACLQHFDSSFFFFFLILRFAENPHTVTLGLSLCVPWQREYITLKQAHLALRMSTRLVDLGKRRRLLNAEEVSLSLFFFLHEQLLS